MRRSACAGRVGRGLGGACGVGRDGVRGRRGRGHSPDQSRARYCKRRIIQLRCAFSGREMFSATWQIAAEPSRRRTSQDRRSNAFAARFMSGPDSRADQPALHGAQGARRRRGPCEVRRIALPRRGRRTPRRAMAGRVERGSVLRSLGRFFPMERRSHALLPGLLPRRSDGGMRDGARFLECGRSEVRAIGGSEQTTARPEVARTRCQRRATPITARALRPAERKPARVSSRAR